MAGATNRQLKTAGIPKASQAQIRVHAGGRLTLKSALDVAAKHGIAVPDKAHAFMAARDLKDRKVALQAASARRGANVTRAIGDASKAALAARKEAARKKSVSRPLDAAKGRGKSVAMGNTKEKLIHIGKRELAPAARQAIKEMGLIADERGGNPIMTKARDRRDHRSGQGRFTGHALLLSKKDGTPVTAADVGRVRAVIAGRQSAEPVKKTDHNEYAAKVAGNDVTLVRSMKRRSGNKGKLYTSTPEWTAYHAGRVIADGNGSRKQALEGAALHFEVMARAK